MRKQFSGIENNNTNIAINKYMLGSLEIIPNGTSILLQSVVVLNRLFHSNLFIEVLAAILEKKIMSILGTNNHIWHVYGSVPFYT